MDDSCLRRPDLDSKSAENPGEMPKGLSSSLSGKKGFVLSQNASMPT